MLHKIFGGAGAPGWIVAFLGNPGDQYRQTRHNMGFLAADMLAKELGVELNRSHFEGLCATVNLADQSVMLLKPQTFMNLSGQSVRAAADFYKVPADHIIVVLDDMNLPAGRLRVRPSGSDGGHNGMKNIIAHLHTDAIPRIRIGVGRPADNRHEDVIDWVIHRISDSELQTLTPAIQRACRAVEEIIARGVTSAMDKYNRPF